MKHIILTCFAILAIFLVARLGFAIGSLALLLSSVVVYLVWHRINYIQTIAYYAKQYENIYIISNHPDSDDKVFDEEAGYIVVCVAYSEVMREVSNQEKLLTESRNQFFCDSGLKDHQRIRVVPIIFQDGQFINETWKEFKKRAIAEIQEDRSSRHAMLKNADSAWYHKYGNNQRHVEWVKKNKKL